MFKPFKKLSQRGQTMVEYGLILALISIVAIVALVGVSDVIKCRTMEILYFGFGVGGFEGEWIGNYICPGTDPFQ